MNFQSGILLIAFGLCGFFSAARGVEDQSPGRGHFCGAGPLNETILDLSASQPRVKVVGAKVSVDSGLRVQFPQAGAGVQIVLPSGIQDLSTYVGVAIDVENPGEKPVTLTGCLNRDSWANGFVHVPPGRTETMVIHLLRPFLTEDPKAPFTRMNGVPGGHIGHWTRFDVAKVKSITLQDLDGISVGQTIRVKTVRGVGRYGPPTGEKRAAYFEKLPKGFVQKGRVDFGQANQRARYGEDWRETAMDIAHRRLSGWGMNTIGNWSDPQLCAQGRTPYVVAIHYRGKDPAMVRRDPNMLREAVRQRLTAEKGKTDEDPWCIGYFIDNELKWREVMDPMDYYRIVSEEMRRAAPNKLYLGSRLHGHDKPHGSGEETKIK